MAPSQAERDRDFNHGFRNILLVPHHNAEAGHAAVDLHVNWDLDPRLQCVGRKPLGGFPSGYRLGNMPFVEIKGHFGRSISQNKNIPLDIIGPQSTGFVNIGNGKSVDPQPVVKPGNHRSSMPVGIGFDHRNDAFPRRQAANLLQIIFNGIQVDFGPGSS